MPTLTTNVSFQKWADNEEPWEQRTDWDKLDDIFSGVTTVPGFATEKRNVADLAGTAGPGSTQTISTGTNTQVSLGSNILEDADAVDVDLSNNKLIAQIDGAYLLSGVVTFEASAGWSSGDIIRAWVDAGGVVGQGRGLHNGANARQSVWVQPVIVGLSSTPTDITLNCRHEAGQDETIPSTDTQTYISAAHLG